MHKPIIIGLVGLITIIYSITQICLYRDLAHEIHSLEQDLGRHHWGEFDYKDGESKFTFYPNIFQNNDKNEFMTLLKNKLDYHWNYFRQRCLDTGNIIMVYDKEVGNCKPHLTKEPFKNSNLSKVLPDMRQINLWYSMSIIGGISIILYAIIITKFYIMKHNYYAIVKRFKYYIGRKCYKDYKYLVYEYTEHVLPRTDLYLKYIDEFILSNIITNNPNIPNYTSDMLLNTIEALRQHINEFKPWWEKDIVQFNPK